MTTKTAPEILRVSAQAKTWEQEINKRVVERQREARGLVIASLARAHHLQLGPPGTAKSYLVTTGLSLIDGAKTMEVLLHGYSVMEDLYGPISLKGLDEDRYFRKTDTYVPWADFVFADEVFKANPTLLNTNLWAFNERKFRNDGKVEDIPLVSAFFASNEGPEDASLQAFDDRIHLRYVVGPIREPAARITMFRMRLERQGRPAPVMTIDELREAHALVASVEIPDVVLENLNNLQEDLAREQIRPTDRKFNDALVVIQATALYNGRSKATIDDMRMLRDMFWSNPKDRPTVAEKVQEMASPIDKDAQVLANDIEALAAQVEEIIAIEQKAIRIRRSVQLHNKLEEANTELAELRARAKAEGTESEIVDEARRRLHSLTKRLLQKGFRVNKSAAELDPETLANLIKEMREEEDA